MRLALAQCKSMFGKTGMILNYNFYCRDLLKSYCWFIDASTSNPLKQMGKQGQKSAHGLNFIIIEGRIQRLMDKRRMRFIRNKICSSGLELRPATEQTKNSIGGIIKTTIYSLTLPLNFPTKYSHLWVLECLHTPQVEK